MQVDMDDVAISASDVSNPNISIEAILPSIESSAIKIAEMKKFFIEVVFNHTKWEFIETLVDFCLSKLFCNCIVCS